MFLLLYIFRIVNSQPLPLCLGYSLFISLKCIYSQVMIISPFWYGLNKELCWRTLTLSSLSLAINLTILQWRPIDLEVWSFTVYKLVKLNSFLCYLATVLCLLMCVFLFDLEAELIDFWTELSFLWFSA